MVLLFFGVALAMLLETLWPHKFASRRGHWIRNGGIALSLALYFALEYGQRTFAPPGGGLFRFPISVVRSLIAVCWVASLWTLGFRLLMMVLNRIKPDYFQRKTRIVDKPISVSQTTASLPETHGVESSNETLGAQEKDPAAEPYALTRREVIQRSFAASSVAGLSTVVGYGLLKGAKDLRVRDVVVAIPSLPRALEGYTISQLTDIHVGLFTGERDFAAVIEKANSLRSDAMVLTGDLLDRNPKFVPEAMRLFAQLRARDGVYAILGNHDYYTGFRSVLAGLNGTSIRTLVNEHLILRPNDGGIVLAGLDEMWAKRLEPGRGPDIARALRGADPELPKVLLAHNPKLFEMALGKVDLQLSGHTHGGQVNFDPMMRRILTYVSGMYRHQNTQLFVSNGLGFTGLPFRINAPPEIVRVVLVQRS